MADGDITVIADSEGILLLGEMRAVDAVVEGTGWEALALTASALSVVGKSLQGGAEIAAAGGRWVKMTPESVGLVALLGPSISKTSGLMMGVVRGDKGRIYKHLTFEAPPSLLNPTTLGSIGGVMTQLAMERAIAEINEYLERIDKKLDAILRDQKEQALADILGIALALDEAMSIRAAVGAVTETTWSKIQSGALSLSRAQALALQKLDALTEEIENADGISELEEATAVVHADARTWLALLAKAVQLQDQLSVIELDRVLHDGEDVELHHAGLVVARRERLDRIQVSVSRIAERLRTAAQLSDLKKVTNPIAVSRVIQRTNATTKLAHEFATHLGLDGAGHDELADRRWGDALRNVLTDTAQSAKVLGQNAAEGVLGVGEGIGDARDRFILKQASAIQKRRLEKPDAPEPK